MILVLGAVLAVLALGLLVWLAVRRRAPALRWKGTPGGARSGELARKLRTLMSGSDLAQVWDALEDALIEADVGAATATAAVDEVRRSRPADGAGARRTLHAALTARLAETTRRLDLEGSPAVWLVVGVNGVGKTTTIAKLAALVQRGGRTPLLAGADTFRAAATEQLRSWGARLAVDVVAGHPGSDPAAVAFDAVKAARARGADVVIVDTAGRLHDKANLMAELSKIARVLRNEAGTIHEALLILDGTTGQNGIAQARSFTAAVGLTGIVVTKLDGTAKGGVVIPIEAELELPVKLIGVGEGSADLLPFDPDEYVSELIGDR